MYHSVLNMLRYHMGVIPGLVLPLGFTIGETCPCVVLDSTLRFRMLDFSHFQKPINNTVGFCSEGRLCTNMVTQCHTYANWALTAELSPPPAGSPQVTTDPAARIAANASRVA